MTTYIGPQEISEEAQDIPSCSSPCLQLAVFIASFPAVHLVEENRNFIYLVAAAATPQFQNKVDLRIRYSCNQAAVFIAINLFLVWRMRSSAFTYISQ